MGYVFQIEVFTVGDGYTEYWSGEDLMEAISQMRFAEDAGYKCIKLEYRPN